MSVRMNPERVGHFTSSNIYTLMSTPTAAAQKLGAVFGKPAMTYIKKVNYERKLKLPITTDTNARPLSWGKLVEFKAFEIMGLEYKHSSQETIVHPKIDFWSGSPDGNKFDDGKTVFDIKCPLTRLSFCQMVECTSIEELAEEHDDGEKYKYQLISNAIITDSKWAELIVYIPYKDELQDIRDMAENSDAEMKKHFYWINSADDEELPYILRGEHYKNLNVIRFEVTDEMKQELTDRVLKAGELLNK